MPPRIASLSRRKRPPYSCGSGAGSTRDPSVAGADTLRRQTTRSPAGHSARRRQRLGEEVAEVGEGEHESELGGPGLVGEDVEEGGDVAEAAAVGGAQRLGAELAELGVVDGHEEGVE